MPCGVGAGSLGAGSHYRIPELMLEPHPEEPVPILCGGESEVALRRAAWRCEGWVGTAYPLEEAARYVERLRGYRREYGREHEPFDIIVALLDVPSPDVYRRAEDIGISGVMCAPWTGLPAERYRDAIERFAEDIVARCT